MKKMKCALWARLFFFFFVWQLAFLTNIAYTAERGTKLSLEIVPVLARVGRTDCNGVKGGFAYYDSCGICVGGNTGKTPCVVIRRNSLPDTGQTGDYTSTFGEDSDYTINAPSYKDNGDGTVTDNVTGLMWQQSAVDGTYNWYQAAGMYSAYDNSTTQNVCAAQSTGGHSDWRLPTKKELIGIVDYGGLFPAINGKFIAQSSTCWYWSSTIYVHHIGEAWSVNFYYGYVGSSTMQEDDRYVRCVRGGQ